VSVAQVQEGGFEGFEEALSVQAKTSAEMTILGACLVDPQALNDATEILEDQDFMLDSHRKIYRAMLDLMDDGEAVDIVTITDRLMRLRHLQDVGGLPYIASLSEGLPRKLAIESYVRIVKDASQRRRTLAECETAITQCALGTLEAPAILETLESNLMSIADGMQVRKFTTLLEEFRGGIDDYISRTFDAKAMTGLATGYTDFDGMTGGLQESELIILAARPSIGKTAWAINIVTNVVLEDPAKVVAVFTIEMSKRALYKRMISSVANVGARRALMGWLQQEDKRKLTSAAIELGQLNIMVDDTPSITPMQMRAKARRLKASKGRLDLIVVDYLQLMTAGRKVENRTAEVSLISRSLKALAKELHVPVLAISSLGRASEKSGNKRPSLADLRESGQIEFDADVVAFIHREEYYQPDNLEVKGLAEITIAKQREGPTGKVDLAYLADITRFENLEK